MSRYIDADEALRMMRNSKQDNPCDTPYKGVWEIAHDCCISCLDAVPIADVVEVVRCKDCKHYGGITYGFVCRKYSGAETKVCTEKDHYCSYGERKEK